MVVCQYFLRGTCKFGSSCRNEHPAGGQQPTFGSTGNSWLRQGTGGSSTKTSSETSLPYDAQTMANDMTQGKEKPMWPLSSYGPGKQEICLITGLDESAEELRVKAYLAIKAGNLNEYLTYEAKQISTADQTFANVRANSAEAFEKSRKQSAIVPYVEPANTNTTSAFGTTTSSAFPSTSSAFATQPTTSAFGTLNTAPTTSVFGTPAFGQPAFGQTSFGQAPTAAPVSAFGQPAQTTTSTSVFGQPSQPATTPAFGQTSQPASVFGQPSFGQPAPNNPLIKPASGAFSAFSGSGPSAFGAAASTPSSNTANSTTGGSGGAFSAFAGNQPSAFGLLANNNNTTSVFGQPSFGQPAPNANANQTSVFGAPSAFGQQPQQQQQPTSVFGNTNPITNVFGGGAPSTSAFGGGGTAAPSVFGGGGGAASAFGGGGNTSSVFGGGNTTSVFGGGAAPSPFGQQQQQDPMSLNTPQPQVTSTPSIAMSSSSQSQSSSSMKTTSSTGPLDLSALNTKFPYQPGVTPYDGLLPENYMELVPQTARELFVAERFEWGKGVPEWVPPVEVR